MSILQELKTWVRFGPDDEKILRELALLVEPHLVPMTEVFYARVLESEVARDVLRDPARVERLMVTLRRWAVELLNGPWDQAYFESRERIGRVHVQVGLPPRYMFVAMNVVRGELCALAHRSFSAEASERACLAIQRITDIDLALMTGTYVAASATSQMSSLQDLIVSNMPVTVLLLDSVGTVTSATRPAARLFGDREPQGADRSAPAVQGHFTEVLPRALLDAADLVEQVRYAQETHREITLPRVDARIDGRDRAFRVTVVPLDHPLARVLLHVEELTETIRTEARLRESESLAQLGALSAAVAHELRNPLAGISGAIQVIARSLPDTDRRKPIMDKVELQVRRLDALVTDLLAFARPSHPRPDRLDLADLSRSVRDLVSRDHPTAMIEVIGEGSATGDANLLSQVLLNLVLNAVQALGGDGQVHLVVAPGRLVVADSGPGVAEENREKIFQPIFTTRARGTGLGLAICRKLVGAMGGRLDLLEQGPLSGAAFVIELPG